MTDTAKAAAGGYAWNPVSGRFVKKSGPTYLRLIKCGVIQDPTMFVVQRAAADPEALRGPPPAAAARRAPAPRDCASACASAPSLVEADDDGSDDEDDGLAARIAELLRSMKTKPTKGGGAPTGRTRPIARARITVGPPAAKATGSGRKQIAALFDDATTDASESESGY
jgi:hypothetical protein